MNPRTKNLVVAGGAIVVVGLVAVNMLTTPPAAPVGDASAGAAGVPSPPGVGVVTSPNGAATSGAPEGDVDAGLGEEVGEADRRGYAVGLHDLAGLPPDAAPGQALELWVTWEPPVTRGPRLHKLIADARLERVVPGPTPEAPVTVLLSVPAARVGDLIYADGFGKLSVVLP